MIKPEISQRQINNVMANFSELPGQVLRAKRRALKRETSRVAGLIRKGIAQENGITQKVLNNRKRIKTPLKSPDLGIVWTGYNNIAFVYAGNPRPIKAGGVSFKGEKYPHAFFARMPSGHVGVYERTSKDRRSLKEKTIPLQHVAEVVQSVRIQAGVRLEERFAQELNYELNVKNTTTVNV